MVFLSDEEAKVLRITLGLDQTNKVYPSRNSLNIVYAERHAAVVADLLKREFLAEKIRDGKPVIVATDAGRVAVIDEPWPRTS